ncbi:hypothetical protein [Rhodococcus sp. 1168]|uniref:hypothetical protein n=1 Tax=Rhodococcus sp. 1168 TaxID=2018041 RepID=UPI001593EFC6|nr:hypothetical protein [Rhodococcus sp. 1168]
MHLPGAESASVLAGWTPDATHWLNPRTARISDTSIEYLRNDDGEWAAADS